jgi:ABC-2 type transport system ATP-binding protein
VQKVCSHFAVLRLGKKIYSGSVEDVLLSTNTIAIAADNRELLQQVLTTCPGVRSSEMSAEGMKAHVSDDWSAAMLNKFLVERNVSVNYIQQKKSSLEEKFLEILKENDSIVSTLHKNSPS